MGCNVVNSAGLGQYIAGFPCPYDSVMDPGAALGPLRQAMGMGAYLDADYTPYPQFLQAKGLGSCGCGCGGGCGMGALTMDGTGLFGSGLFSSPFDISTWSIGEYMALAMGAYMLYALVGTTKAEARRASRGYRRVKGSLRRKPMGTE